MTEIAFDVRHKEGDVQILGAQSMNVCEGGKVGQVMATEVFRQEPNVVPLVYSEFLDERHQTELMQLG
jgi:hypothetical protein